MAFGFAALVGLFFGLYPASRAASLSLADALACTKRILSIVQKKIIEPIRFL